MRNVYLRDSFVLMRVIQSKQMRFLEKKLSQKDCDRNVYKKTIVTKSTSNIWIFILKFAQKIMKINAKKKYKKN